ncbi:hypothetical protein JCM10213_007927 [Rhodosporidiobolus nylandii]
MYRSAYGDSYQDDPRGLTRNGNTAGGLYGRRSPLLSSRARIHPVVLVPVFLFGAFFSPFFTRHFDSSGGLRMPEPVYRPQDYEWKANEVFAEPDAPPLAVDEDAALQRSGRNGQKAEKVLARDGHGDGADEWEWWDPSSSSDLTAQLYTVNAGILYFQSSPITIPTLSSSHGSPFPPYKPDSARVPARPRMPDEGLTLPPPPPASWLAPGELFAHPPGRRKHAVDHSALVDLHAPLPPAPARGNAFLAQQERQEAQARARQARQPRGAAGRKKKVEKDAAGHVLGPNAAAMARAKREGKPFSPGKPLDLQAEEAELKRRQKQERARQKALEQKKAGVVWARADDKPKPAPILETEEEDEAHGDDDELLDLEAAAAAEAEVEDLDPDDDAALLAAIRALSPAELAELSPEEQTLVKELEAAEAAALGAKKPARPARPNWQERDPALIKPRREAPLAPPKPPVYKGPQGNQRGPAPGARKAGLRKRWFEAEEPVAAAAEPASSSLPAEISLSSSSTAPADASIPAATLTRRTILEDLAPAGGKPAPSDRLHPIAHLISRAEEAWDDLLRKQSQTLEQAVEEYKRRYGMKPPAGFDAWWRYAMENRVVLVDEYDQIYEDLLPFFSLPPSELRRRAEQLHEDAKLPWHGHSFGVQIKDGSVSLGHKGSDSGGARTEDLLDLLGDFAEMLPDLKLRFAEGDEPAIVISGEARARHVQYARRGQLLGLSQSYEVLEPTGFTAWDALCPPNSTARRLAQGLAVDAPTGNSLKSFVSTEHGRTMDLCEHPEVRRLNGLTASWTGPRPHVLYPLFSFTKTSVHADILVPAISNDYYVEVGRDPVWEQKKHNKVLWRGDTTGAFFARGTGWRQTQRARLVSLANNHDGDTTLHLASLSPDDALRRVIAPTADVTQHYFDVAFAGKPAQCSNKDKTCALLQHEFRWDRSAKPMRPDDENQYKYVLDVDANYPSGKFKRYMSSRSLVLKSTIFPEWWTKRIMPWYHYVPVKSDYSDLVDISAFFIGLPDGTGSHDHLAKRIAAQGKKWAEEHWREVDMAAYMFRLYLEYARLLNRDENNLHSMDYAP